MNHFYRFAHRLLRVVLWPFHRVEAAGVEKLAKSGVLLCPNHGSNWDPIMIAMALPVDFPLRVMAKQSLFEIPVVGFLIRKLGAFPVRRGESDLQAVKTAIQAIKSGENLLIFPQGTVVEDDGIGRIDGKPARAKGGVAVIGVRTGAILVPVYVGKVKTFHRTKVVFGDPYIPTYTGRHGTAEEMQQIADTLVEQAYELGGVHSCKKSS